MARKVLTNEEIFDLVFQIKDCGRATSTKIEMKGKSITSIEFNLKFELQEDVIKFYNQLKESK